MSHLRFGPSFSQVLPFQSSQYNVSFLHVCVDSGLRGAAIYPISRALSVMEPIVHITTFILYSVIMIYRRDDYFPPLSRLYSLGLIICLGIASSLNRITQNVNGIVERNDFATRKVH